MKKAFYFETKMGQIGIAESDGCITNVFFGNTVVPDQFKLENTPLLKKAADQLDEYFEGQRKKFDLPLKFEGSEFEKNVWNALLTIGYGEVKTYRQIAEQVSSPKAYRAVGRANGQNPISIFAPCHRVIGSDGKMTGYAGGLDMKEKLLNLEKNTLSN